jgi:hypothetical protein
MSTGINSAGLRAGGNIEPMRIVKISDSRTVIQATANDRAIGVSGRSSNVDYDDTKHASTGSPGVEVRTAGQVAYVECGGSISGGNFVKSDANGKAVASATTGTTAQEVVGTALEDGADGEIILMLVNPVHYYPALS